MRVLVFGASITQGFYDRKGGWVARLIEHYIGQLLDDPKAADITVFNLGIAGDGSDRLLKRFKDETDARKFPGEDFVFIFSIGTNNSWVRANGEATSTTEKYSDDIKNLIEHAREYSQKIMFLGLPPCDETRANPVPWNNDIYFTNERLRVFDGVLKKVCEKENIKYLPIFDSIQKKMEDTDLYEDGLHPNDAGHKLIFELVQPELDKLLNT